VSKLKNKDPVLTRSQLTIF